MNAEISDSTEPQPQSTGQDKVFVRYWPTASPVMVSYDAALDVATSRINAPPYRGELPPAEISLIGRWIDEGAEWPDGVGSSVAQVEKHRAFVRRSVRRYPRYRSFVSMAVHTAVSFLILPAGILLAMPDRGPVGLLRSPDLGGVLARRLIPGALLFPILLGWLRLKGQREGLFGAELGLALFVVLFHDSTASEYLWPVAPQTGRLLSLN